MRKRKSYLDRHVTVKVGLYGLAISLSVLIPWLILGKLLIVPLLTGIASLAWLICAILIIALRKPAKSN